MNYDPLNEEIIIDLIKDEEARENAKTVGYFAMFELINGFRKTLYWSRAKMEAHAMRYSQGYRAKKGYTYWEKDFDGMAQKTMLRQLLSKWGVMSIDLQTALEDDYAVINEDGSKNYVDAVVQETPKEIEVKTETGYSKRTETTEDYQQIAEEAPKEEAEKKAAKKKTIKTEPEEPANDAAAALFGEESAE